MMTFFILLQFFLLFFMLFHDWVAAPPLNDVSALRKVDGDLGRLKGSIVNGLCVFIPLFLTLRYADTNIPLSAIITIFCFYFGLTVGTICSWWIPYFFGSSKKHKELFQKFSNTHHFLPKRNDNVVPNTLHVLLHFQVWVCLLISIYYLIELA